MVKHVWNVSVHLLHNFWQFFLNTIAYNWADTTYPSSPSAKELHSPTLLL